MPAEKLPATDISPEDLPLLELFTQLREAGLPLGIGEYQWVLKAWQAGYGTADRAALKRLCRTVWVKSPEDARIFEIQFDRLVQQVPTRDTPRDGISPSRSPWVMLRTLALAGCGLSMLMIAVALWPQSKNFQSGFEQVSPLLNAISEQTYEAALRLVPDDPQVPQEEPQLEPPAAIPIVVLQPWWKQQGLVLWLSLGLVSVATWVGVQIRLAATQPQRSGVRPDWELNLTQQMPDEVQVARLGQAIPTGDYLPVTRRQMKQSWRYLRRMVREGPPTDLDVEATVHEVGRQGLLLAPVFQARRVNRAEVLLLVDQEGSMVPFQGLSRRLVETALQGGRSTQARVYYFHNCPVGWLYHDPYQQTAESVEQVLKTLTSDYAGALIVSDGGAACGRWHPGRLALTEQFLGQLRQRVRYVAWLNPMPQPRWAGTTAGEIAQRVPMFEFDRAGLDAAIRVLRGQRGHHP